MAQHSDAFVGTWKLNPASSDFDPNYRPTDAVMVWDRQADGSYTMTAEGTVNGKIRFTAARVPAIHRIGPFLNPFG